VKGLKVNRIASNITKTIYVFRVKYNLTHVHTASRPSERPTTGPRLQSRSRILREPLKPSDCIIVMTILLLLLLPLC